MRPTSFISFFEQEIQVFFLLRAPVAVDSRSFFGFSALFRDPAALTGPKRAPPYLAENVNDIAKDFIMENNKNQGCTAVLARYKELKERSLFRACSVAGKLPVFRQNSRRFLLPGEESYQ